MLAVVFAESLKLVGTPGVFAVVLAESLKLVGTPGNSGASVSIENEIVKSLVFALLSASWHLT